MAFTRFHDDPCRISKQNQQATDPGRWILDVPGNGEKPCFMEDPQIIAQKWGGNLYCNKVDAQSFLLGIDRKLTKYNIGSLEKAEQSLTSHSTTYPTCNWVTTEQSRTTNPAWMYKDLEQPNWDFLLQDPQAHVERPFVNNVSSRIIEKDQFQRQFDCVTNFKTNNVPISNSNTHYAGGPTTCSGSNSCGFV